MRYFIFLFLFTCRLLALNIVEDITPVYKEIELAYNIDTIEEVLQHSNEFETVKYFRRHLRRNKNNDNLWLKISLENNQNTDIYRQLVIMWKETNLQFYVVDDQKIVASQTIEEKGGRYRYASEFKIPSRERRQLYIHARRGKVIDQFNSIYLIAPEKFYEFIVEKERYYHNGLFAGIILTMMMYSFFMFFSIKEKSYLYLGFYQLWILLIVSGGRGYLFILLQDFPEFAYYLLKSFYTYIMVCLSILFTKAFLNTKEKMPKLDTLLNISIVLLAILHAIPGSINYGVFLYLVYVVVGIYAFWKGNLSALFYTLGFLGFAVFAITVNLSRLFGWDIYFEYLEMRQITAVLEAFALSMALYLKLKGIVEEKEKAQKETIRHEKMMLEQSRFASMGEMLASIAHQWRQPLNHLGLINNNLRLAERKKRLSSDYLNKKLTESDKQLQYMSSTIDDFSNFFATKGKEEKFKLIDACEYAVELVESRLNKYKIVIALNSTDHCEYVNYKNELVQVLTIIFNNAIDVLMLNNVDDRKIDVTISYNTISIQDNAGGISEEILSKIFDPYFSTKDKKFGTGLGLYMAKILMKNIIHGDIVAVNISNGAQFTLTLP